MNPLNLKNDSSNKECKNPLVIKEPIIEFNEKTDFLSAFKYLPKENNTEYKLDKQNESKKALKNLSIRNSNFQSEIKNPLINSNLSQKKKNILEENQIKKAETRLDFEKLIFSDNFAENFSLIPSSNFQNNVNYDLPYLNPFEDRIMLQDESMFFIFDKNYKKKFLTKEDINAIQKEEPKLNFGKDPFEIYGQIYNGSISSHSKSSIELYNSLSNFNIFKCRDPYFINIKAEFLNNESGDDNFNMIDNYTFTNIYESINGNNSVNSTRENSKISPNMQPVIRFETDFLHYLTKDLEKEGDEINGNENVNNITNNNYLGKKRNYKK